MATRWETFPIKLEGGLVTDLGRLEQGFQMPGSATILQNFEPAVEGGYTKVLGYEKFSETEVTGTGTVFGVVAVDNEVCLALREGKWYHSTGTTWTEKATLANPSVTRIRAERYNFDGTAKVVITDGVNNPVRYDSAAATMTYFTAPPAEVTGAFDVKNFKNHLFFAKGSTLTFAAPYSDEDFAAANGAGSINVGDSITGLFVFRDQLFVFSLNSIRRLVGNTLDDFQLLSVTQNTGCICGHTIQEVGGDIMYLGPDGIRYLSASERENDFGLARASARIQKQVLAAINSNCFYSSLTIASKNQYRLFTYVATVPKTNAEGFLATKYSNQTAEDISWANLRGFKVYSASKYQNRDREVILFSSDTGFVYRMNTSNSFDGEDIEAIFETPYMPIRDPKVRKTVYKHTLYAKPNGPMDLSVTIKWDYAQSDASQPSSFTISGGAGVAVYGTSVYGTDVYGVQAEENFYNNAMGSGFVVAVNYYDKSTNPPYNLNFTTLELRENEKR